MWEPDCWKSSSMALSEHLKTEEGKVFSIVSGFSRIDLVETLLLLNRPWSSPPFKRARGKCQSLTATASPKAMAFLRYRLRYRTKQRVAELHVSQKFSNA